MKIGMLADTFLPILGGGEIHVLELSRCLRNSGHQIQICTAKDGNPIEDGFPVLRLPALMHGNIHALLIAPLYIPRLTRLIKSVDIVHCHYSFFLAAIGTIICRFFNKPCLVTLHGLGTLDSSVSKYKLYPLYRFLSLKYSDHVIATSQEMKSVAAKFVPEQKITIIPNGVDPVKFAPRTGKKSTKPLVVLSMRRLAPKNGVQYLVEATKYIIEECPGVEFWISGEGKLEAFLRQRVSELHLDHAVRFIGSIPFENTADYYAEADIVAFPSSAESTSLACLEAMSMGKAIVASNLSAFQEMLGDSERGLLVNLFDRLTSDYNAPKELPDDKIRLLASAIARLAKDKVLRSDLGEAARNHILKNYSWEMITGETGSIYTQVLQFHSQEKVEPGKTR